jgi:DNA-binding MarR family transcriptional regulator
MSITKAISRARPAEPLDLSRYAPFYLTTIANRWTASSSQIYQRDFGIGIAEWRVLAALSVLGSATSLEVVTMISMDAAAVSRAMKTLATNGHVKPVVGRFKGRNKPFEMTAAGVAKYEKIHQVAIKREKLLLRSLDEAERSVFLRALQKIHVGLNEL